MKTILHLGGVIVLAGLPIACGQETTDGQRVAELPTLDITAWTDKTELFMEYPPLVTRQPALYAVHLTRLSDFSAMTAGRPRLEFTPEAGGAPVVLQGKPPSRPGAYRIEGASPAAGSRAADTP